MEESNNIEILFEQKNNDANISLIMMVKNESKRIHVTLNSVINIVNRIIIYDTGSTDETINIIKEFSLNNKISLYVKFGTFIDFSVSRNILLDYANNILNTDFLLLMDANDELINGDKLIQFCKENKETKEFGFFIKQKWLVHCHIEYFNIRLIRANNNWKFIGKVHEYIHRPNYTPIIIIPDVILFQNRLLDDDKSFYRFSVDEKLLMEEYNSINKTERTIFYLAQTKECLGKKEEAIKYYKERSMVKNSFIEEVFQSIYKVGMLLKEIKEPFEIYSGYFLLAISTIPNRIEPFIRLTEYYISIRSWNLAYLFIKHACDMQIPFALLFLDIECYKYYRWHLMGIIAYYVNKYEDGLKACEIAIKERNNNIDIYNLSFYKNELNSKNLLIKMQLL